jgi:hypothetical protein
MLKICKFCNKAFIPRNSKAEYDTHSARTRQMYIVLEKELRKND